MARRLCAFVVVPVFATPLTRNRRFAFSVSVSEHLHSQFLKDLPSEIAVFGFHVCHLAIPARAFFADLPRNSPIFCRFSSPLFVALSTGCLGPSWGLLGAVLGHLGGRLDPLRAEMWGPVPETRTTHFYIIDNIGGHSNPGDPPRAEMWGPVPETRKTHFYIIDNISGHSILASLLEPKFGVRYPRRRLLRPLAAPSRSARGRCEIVMIGMCTRWYYEHIWTANAVVICSGRPQSMYMWCPHDIGRDSWVWGEQEAL